MSTTIVADKTIGTRTLAGTEWPIRAVVIRHAMPGRRPTWVQTVVCNGMAIDGGVEFTTRRAALAAHDNVR